MAPYRPPSPSPSIVQEFLSLLHESKIDQAATYLEPQVQVSHPDVCLSSQDDWREASKYLQHRYATMRFSALQEGMHEHQVVRWGKSGCFPGPCSAAYLEVFELNAQTGKIQSYYLRKAFCPTSLLARRSWPSRRTLRRSACARHDETRDPEEIAREIQQMLGWSSVP